MFNQLEGVNEFCAGNVKPNFVLNLGGKTSILLFCEFSTNDVSRFIYTCKIAHITNIFS